MLLPLRAGGHRLVIEVSRVIEVVAGSVRSLPVDDEHPVIRAELHALLDLPEPDGGDTVIARADGRKGRQIPADGELVAFTVDHADRLIAVPLEQFAPFPPIAREQMRADFLVGIVRLPVRGASWQDATTAAEPLAYLLDPARLAKAAYA